MFSDNLSHKPASSPSSGSDFVWQVGPHHLVEALRWNGYANERFPFVLLLHT